MSTLAFTLIAALSHAGATAGTSPADPCSGVTAPPIVISSVHEGPIDIALAWHSPTANGEVLNPPLETYGMICNGETVLGPRMLQAGDRITQGAITNAGDTPVTMLTSAGDIMTLPPGRSMWIGTMYQLQVTHHCTCECTCILSNGASRDVSFACQNGSCPNDKALCRDWTDRGKLTLGKLWGCQVVYVPLPLPDKP